MPGAAPAAPRSELAMEEIRLRDGVSFCRVGGRYVFLDVNRDRYFTLQGSAAAAFDRLAEGFGPLDPCERSRLLETGLVVASDVRQLVQPASIRRPTRSLFDETAERARFDFLLLAEVTCLVARTGRRRRREPLAAVITPLLAPGGGTDGRDPLPLARRFNAVRPWAPAKPHCLTDSLALRAFLRRRGATAQIVFGVKLTPFAAHAWVQKGDLVLNDHVDRIREYTPVLVV